MRIRIAEASDMEACVQLAEARRALYETFEPPFWRWWPRSTVR